jgi:hypothetical protein
MRSKYQDYRDGLVGLVAAEKMGRRPCRKKISDFLGSVSEACFIGKGLLLLLFPQNEHKPLQMIHKDKIENRMFGDYLDLLTPSFAPQSPQNLSALKPRPQERARNGKNVRTESNRNPFWAAFFVL